MHEDLSKATIADFAKRAPSTTQFMPSRAVFRKLILRATQITNIADIVKVLNPKEEICDPDEQVRILDP